MQSDSHVQLIEAEEAEPQEDRLLSAAVLRPYRAIDLGVMEVTREEAAEARWRCGAMAADWDLPEMDVYDD